MSWGLFCRGECFTTHRHLIPSPDPPCRQQLQNPPRPVGQAGAQAPGSQQQQQQQQHGGCYGGSAAVQAPPTGTPAEPEPAAGRPRWGPWSSTVGGQAKFLPPTTTAGGKVLLLCD